MSTPAAVVWQKNPDLAWREIDDETVTFLRLTA